MDNETEVRGIFAIAALGTALCVYLILEIIKLWNL